MSKSEEPRDFTYIVERGLGKEYFNADEACEMLIHGHMVSEMLTEFDVDSENYLTYKNERVTGSLQIGSLQITLLYIDECPAGEARSPP